MLFTVLLVFACVLSCTDKSSVHEYKVLVEFTVAIEELNESPPHEFSLLEASEKEVLYDLLNREGGMEYTHIMMQKYVKDGVPHLYISNFTTYARNGKTWSDASTYVYSLKNGSWELTGGCVT